MPLSKAGEYNRMFNWWEDLKTSIETGLKTGIEAGAKAIAETVQSSLQTWFQMPEPNGPFEPIYQLGTTGQPLSTACVPVGEAAWRIESYGEGTIPLFEIKLTDHQECLLLCRAQFKTRRLQKPPKLELQSTHVSGWSVSRHISLEEALTWQTCELPWHFQPQQSSGLLRVSLAFEESGMVWLQQVELLRAPIKIPQPQGDQPHE